MVAQVAPPAPAGEGGADILIVDDLHEKHVVFRSILEDLGDHIVSARSGSEALAQVLSREFAVILLDVNMPDIDGLETASLIRRYKRSARTPIVFITSHVDELQARRGYELGAVDYIPSPVLPEVLRSKVRVFVELFRMNRELQLRAAEREALARAEAARTAAEEAMARADFLAEASQRLARSLDLEETTRSLLELAVPRVASRAMLVGTGLDGSVRVQHVHPPAAQVIEGGLAEAVRQAIAHKEVVHWPEETAPPGADHALVLPLQSADATQRALVLSAQGQPFDKARVALATELVNRAAIAMENARLYAAVQQADRRKNEFLAMLAHELRNPLAPIRNAVHIMQGQAVEPATVTWARDVISRQADHMTRLIDDLLDVSRIVQGKVVVRPEPLLLSTLVDRSVESSAPRLAARNQQLRISMPDQPVALDGDPVRLAQVLSNLVNNASKFSPSGSQIDLGASFDGTQVRLSVRDAGCGIAAEVLPHIFELFVQGDQTLDRSQGGLGIGLTLVKHLVEQHAGHVEARSEGVGRGAEMTVCLPARTGESPPAACGTHGTERADGAGARVLVVDDLAASAETLTLLLEMEGYRVRVASDGPAALRIAEEFCPDVVLLDIGLPGMNGFEVAQRLRQSATAGEALLIALTGYGEAESRTRSAQAGFDFHMVKPADVNLLLSMVADPRQARRARVG